MLGAEDLNVIIVLNAIFQTCNSTPGAAGPRSACGRAVGSFVPRDAGVSGDPGDGPSGLSRRRGRRAGGPAREIRWALSRSSHRRGTRRRRKRFKYIYIEIII